MRNDGGGGDLLSEAMAQTLAKGKELASPLEQERGALPVEGAGTGPEAGMTMDCSPAPRREYCWSKWTRGRERQGQVRNVNFLLRALRSRQKVLITGVA